jgi:methylated-DNA-[protein]-cysteine S-methyltransferase
MLSTLQTAVCSCPLGFVILQTDLSGQSLASAQVVATLSDTVYRDEANAPVLTQAICQIQEYFAGKRDTFDLPLAPQGTAFQQQVWQALQAVTFGETVTYGELAKRLGDPKLVRAVGAANGANPLFLVVPCHRVVGAGGKLLGYNAGIERKRWLLDFEAKRSGQRTQVGLFD